MASVPLKLKSHYHVRSVSLPSRLHPLTPKFDEHLSRLRSSDATSSSLSSIGNKLSILEDMHQFLDESLVSPKTQRAFAKNEKWVEEMLDGYLRLLDLCATAKDISLHTKKDVQDLLSVLRRRRDANEIGKYLSSRKKAKKVIQKSLKDLKNIKIDTKENKTEAVGTLFKEAEAATVEVFESLLSYIIAGTKTQSRLSGLVTKIIHGKSVLAKDEATNTNEFEKVDAALDLFINQKTNKTGNAMLIENVQNQLGIMELRFQDLEEGLECLFRRLIKTRVSLLNVLNH